MPPGAHSKEMNNSRFVYAHFAGPEIFLEQGRLLFAILRTFAVAGYQISLFDNLAGKQLDKYGQMVHQIPELTLVSDAPADTSGLLLYDVPDSVQLARNWRKAVQVRFDLFAPFWFSDPIIMPFPMHPLQSAFAEEEVRSLRNHRRCMRIFFAGDTEHYGRVWVRYPTVKMPRQVVIDALRQHLGDHLKVVSDTEELETLKQSAYLNRCVITGSSKVRIAAEDWLTTIASADFFLCPPGIVMPMCHNIIEAMAVGTIPLTNYPEWMDPPLTHMQDCIAFDGEADLLDKVRGALSLPADEIARMRANVIDYYERHMRPQGFVARIESSKDAQVPILMYTERNMARNPKKLGRGSILIQGTARPRPAHWLRRMASAFFG